MENLKSLSPKRMSHAQTADSSGMQVPTCSSLREQPIFKSDFPQILNSRQLLPVEHTYSAILKISKVLTNPDLHKRETQQTSQVTKEQTPEARSAKVMSKQLWRQQSEAIP